MHQGTWCTKSGLSNLQNFDLARDSSDCEIQDLWITRTNSYWKMEVCKLWAIVKFSKKNLNDPKMIFFLKFKNNILFKRFRLWVQNRNLWLSQKSWALKVFIIYCRYLVWRKANQTSWNVSKKILLIFVPSLYNSKSVRITW